MWKEDNVPGIWQPKDAQFKEISESRAVELIDKSGKSKESPAVQ